MRMRIQRLTRESKIWHQNLAHEKVCSWGAVHEWALSCAKAIVRQRQPPVMTRLLHPSIPDTADSLGPILKNSRSSLLVDIRWFKLQKETLVITTIRIRCNQIPWYPEGEDKHITPLFFVTIIIPHAGPVTVNGPSPPRRGCWPSIHVLPVGKRTNLRS